jgi:type I restriction enzyme, S subunit
MRTIPDAWVETSLANVCDVILGQSPPGTAYNDEGVGLPFFQGKAEFGLLYPSAKKWTTKGNKRAQPGDVLISVRAPVGPTNLAPFQCVIGRGLAALRPSAATTTKFVLYQLRATQDLLASVATGSTFSAVSGSQLREHEFVLPPLPEQERIVAVIEEQFSRLDEGEHLLRSARRRAERLRTAAMAAAIAGDWPIKALADVTAKQEYGSSAKASAAQASGVPIVRMGNIQDGRIDLSRDVKYLPTDHPDVARYRLKVGDLLFNRTNSPELVGKSAVFRGTPGSACFASYLIRVQLDECCLPEWASLYLNSPGGRRWAASVRSQQVGQANINGSKLAAMPMPLPPVDEQRRILAEFERQVSLVESAIAVVDHSLVRSGDLRRAVLGRAFSGRLVPQDPADPPASELLACLEMASGSGPKVAPRRKRS